MNPAFGMGGGAGTSSKFGINEEDLPQLKALLDDLPVTVEGIHVHLKSQNLDADVLGGCYRTAGRWPRGYRRRWTARCVMSTSAAA